MKEVALLPEFKQVLAFIVIIAQCGCEWRNDDYLTAILQVDKDCCGPNPVPAEFKF